MAEVTNGGRAWAALVYLANTLRGAEPEKPIAFQLDMLVAEISLIIKAAAANRQALCAIMAAVAQQPVPPCFEPVPELVANRVAEELAALRQRLQAAEAALAAAQGLGPETDPAELKEESTGKPRVTMEHHVAGLVLSYADGDPAVSIDLVGILRPRVNASALRSLAAVAQALALECEGTRLGEDATAEEGSEA